MPHNVDPRVLGTRLLEARKARGMTQEKAAEQLGCSRPILIAIEKGSRPAKPDELITLAGLYGRSVHELVRPGAPNVALAPHLRAAMDAKRGESEEMVTAIDALQRWADDYRELEQLTGAKPIENFPPEVTVPIHTDISRYAEDVAYRERAWLHLGDQPIPNLRQVLEENVGLRVFYDGMPSAVAGIYAYVAELGYCVLINRRHPRERQRLTLAHEYGHFLCDRHKPGIDYLDGEHRRPANEIFAERFAISFLMPEPSVRQRFYIVASTMGDFQVADLVRLSSVFSVSVQAMTLRLEELALIDSGAWDFLKENKFKPQLAQSQLNIEPAAGESQEPYPQRYKYIAVQAFCQGSISEGLLARFLRTDRVTSRDIVSECLMQRDIDQGGHESMLELPFSRSLVTKH